MIDFKTIENMTKLHLNVVITGANSGIGFETMRFLNERGANIIFGARSVSKSNEALSLINKQNPKSKILFFPLDLGDSKSIYEFSNFVKISFKKIDVLINNAGIMSVPYGKTNQGYEQQIGINHLGHFILTHALKDILSTHARIINVSSLASLNGKIYWKDIQFENSKYTPFKSYSQSKLANLLFSEYLVEYYKNTSVKIITVHPGVVKTGLLTRKETSTSFKLLFKVISPFIKNAVYGAKPLITAALSDNVVSGDFLGPKVKRNPNYISQNERKNRIALDPSNVKRFFDWSEKITNVSYHVKKPSSDN